MSNIFEHCSSRQNWNSRTYNNVTNYVLLELEYDLYVDIKVQGLPEDFLRAKIKSAIIRCDMDIERVGFNEIIFLLETVRFY